MTRVRTGYEVAESALLTEDTVLRLNLSDIDRYPNRGILSVMEIFRQLTHISGCRQRFVIRVSRAVESRSGQAVEKEIDRGNATVPGNDKIGSRVSWWFAGNAGYPSNSSGIT
jgi:hypothetical protein